MLVNLGREHDPRDGHRPALREAGEARDAHGQRGLADDGRRPEAAHVHRPAHVRRSNRVVENRLSFSILGNLRTVVSHLSASS